MDTKSEEPVHVRGVPLRYKDVTSGAEGVQSFGKANRETVAGTCAILVLGTPSSLSVGLDYCLWTTGPKFMGIRGIPCGPHFFFWEPPDENEMGVLGFFCYLQPNQVVVRRWCRDTDAFEELDADEAERYVAGVRRGDFNLNLGPYPSEWISRWKELSQYITKDVVDRIEPVRKFIGAKTKEYDGEDTQKEAQFQQRLIEAIDEDTAPDGRSQSEDCSMDHDRVGNDVTPQNKASCSSVRTVRFKEEPLAVEPQKSIEVNDASRYINSDTLFFCDIPKQRLPPDSCATATTRLSLDRSAVLQQILDTQLEGDWTQLLGEIQMAYVCFLLGQNYPAFEQWKSLVTLLSECEEAVEKHPNLYAGFLRVLHGHLLQAPDDFFKDALMAGNFLVRCLGNLCEVCGDAKAPEQLRRRVSYIKDLVSQKFQMTLEELLALDEDAPVVMDLNEPFLSLDDGTSLES